MTRALRVFLVAAGFVLAATGVFASPVGTYDVVGTNPDNDGEYSGVVTVTQTGETYQIVWDIAGTRFIGTGLGALIQDNQFLIGPADKNDTAISVGYTSGNSFGMAMYFLKADGRWEGVWTSGGSRNVATETWYPR